MSDTDNSTIAASRDNDADRFVYEDGFEEEKGDMNEGDKDVVDKYTKSPYATAVIITLLIGPAATHFSIHSTILAQSPMLAAKVDWSSFHKRASLPDLDGSTAHTLIHFLYTHTYAPLPTRTHLPLHLYRVAITTYCAAISYQLPALADLSKEHLLSLSPEISIQDILAVARDHAFCMLPDEDTWYEEYVEDMVRNGMKDDPETVRRPEFIVGVGGCKRLLEVVWRGVVGGIGRDEGVAMATETETGVMRSSGGPDAGEVDLAGREEEVGTRVSEQEDESESPVSTSGDILESSSEQATPVIEAVHPTNLELDEIEPTIETFKISKASAEELNESEPLIETPQGPQSLTQDLNESDAVVDTPQALDVYKENLNESDDPAKAPSAPEPFTDELGFETSKMYWQMGKKPDSVSTSLGDNTEDQSHKRSDSFMQGADVTCRQGKNEKEGDIASPPANGSSGNIATSKKAKKMKKKKNPTTF